MVVLDRATAPGKPIEPKALLDFAADIHLRGEFDDVQMRSALQLAVSDIFLQRGDFPRALELLDALDSGLSDDRLIAQAAVRRAQAAIRTGKFDQAEAALDRAEQNTSETQRSGGSLPATVLMTRGQLLRARGDGAGAGNLVRTSVERALDATDASPLARAARDASHAKVQATLGQSETALAMIDRATQRMCEVTGAASFDCLRMRLSRIDTELLCARLDLASRNLAELAPALDAMPPLKTALETQSLSLTALENPEDTARLDALIARLTTSGKAGALQRISAERNLLLWAEQLLAQGHEAPAKRLADAALTLSDPAATTGMDASLIAWWRARREGHPPPDDTLSALARSVGVDHPMVLRRQPE